MNISQPSSALHLFGGRAIPDKVLRNTYASILKKSKPKKIIVSPEAVKRRKKNFCKEKMPLGKGKIGK